MMPSTAEAVQVKVDKVVAGTYAAYSPLKPGSGDMITVGALLLGAEGVAAPTGTITFLERSTVLASVPLGADGRASLKRTMSVGSHQITVSYGGDAIPELRNVRDVSCCQRGDRTGFVIQHSADRSDGDAKSNGSGPSGRDARRNDGFLHRRQAHRQLHRQSLAGRVCLLRHPAFSTRQLFGHCKLQRGPEPAAVLFPADEPNCREGRIRHLHRSVSHPAYVRTPGNGERAAGRRHGIARAHRDGHICGERGRPGDCPRGQTDGRLWHCRHSTRDRTASAHRTAATQTIPVRPHPRSMCSSARPLRTPRWRQISAPHSSPL